MSYFIDQSMHVSGARPLGRGIHLKEQKKSRNSFSGHSKLNIHDVLENPKSDRENIIILNFNNSKNTGKISDNKIRNIASFFSFNKNLTGDLDDGNNSDINSDIEDSSTSEKLNINQTLSNKIDYDKNEDFMINFKKKNRSKSFYKTGLIHEKNQNFLFPNNKKKTNKLQYENFTNNKESELFTSQNNSYSLIMPNNFKKDCNKSLKENEDFDVNHNPNFIKENEDHIFKTGELQINNIKNINNYYNINNNSDNLNSKYMHLITNASNNENLFNSNNFQELTKLIKKKHLEDWNNNLLNKIQVNYDF